MAKMAGNAPPELQRLRALERLAPGEAAEIIALWKTHEAPAVRKEAKKALERLAPGALAGFTGAVRGSVGTDDKKLSKKLAALHNAVAAGEVELDGLSVADIALQILRRTPERLGLNYLCTLGGAEALEGLQAALDEEGRLDLGGYKPLPIGSPPRLPEELAQVEGLRALFLNSCGLREIPPVVFRLHRLEHLDLSNNRLNALPDELAGLRSLQRLTLRKAPLKKGVGKLPPLKTLQIYFTDLRDATPLLLPSLEELVLFDAPLPEIPPEIARARSLRKLEWPRGVTRIADELWSLTGLEELDLSGLEMPALPPALGKLSKLRELSLRGARIETLPESIGELQALEDLDLVFAGALKTLPDSFYGLKLKRLRVQYTPLEARAAEIRERMPGLTIYK